MGILDSVERGLERAVNGAFARTFRSGVQPVEIAAALKRELDIGSVVVDRDRVLAPNRFVVRVSEADSARLRGMGARLEGELIGVVRKHAKSQGYQLLGEPDVELRADPALTGGVLQIDASQVENGTVAWQAILEINGVQHPLKQGTTIVGRGSDANIRITDDAASRQHMQVIWNGSTGIARDMGSTNGTKINGERFREAALSPDTVFTIGKTSLRFMLVPARTAAPTTQPAHTIRSPQASATPAATPSAAATRNPAEPSQPAQPAQPSQPAIDEDFWRGL